MQWQQVLGRTHLLRTEQQEAKSKLWNLSFFWFCDERKTEAELRKGTLYKDHFYNTFSWCNGTLSLVVALLVYVFGSRLGEYDVLADGLSYGHIVSCRMKIVVVCTYCDTLYLCLYCVPVRKMLLRFISLVPDIFPIVNRIASDSTVAITFAGLHAPNSFRWHTRFHDMRKLTRHYS